MLCNCRQRVSCGATKLQYKNFFILHLQLYCNDIAVVQNIDVINVEMKIKKTLKNVKKRGENKKSL